MREATIFAALALSSPGDRWKYMLVAIEMIIKERFNLTEGFELLLIR